MDTNRIIVYRNIIVEFDDYRDQPCFEEVEGRKWAPIFPSTYKSLNIETEYRTQLPVDLAWALPLGGLKG